jgi:glutamine cyclotransferase
MSQNILASRQFIFLILALIYVGTGQLFAYESKSEPAKGPGSQNIIKPSPVIYVPRIIKTYPHDPQAFTQGLVFEDGYLYEGTGLYGKSSLRKTVLETGHVEQRLTLPSQLFGEGITIIQDKLIQLTWRSHVGFVYAKDSFKLIRIFQYSTEGWGITYDGKQLIMSDGTEHLCFINPGTYEISGKVRVYDDNGFITKLNELEYIKGLIYANVWQSSRIAIIDPLNGQVNGWIELQELVRIAGGNNTTKTLNGIAYDEKSDRLFITGKMWPDIYEIQIAPSAD